MQLYQLSHVYYNNNYRAWGSLIFSGANRFLYTKEGVTQGDPLSMFMYMYVISSIFL